MATTSEVKAGLDEIASAIRSHRASMKSIISNASGVSGGLATIPTSFQDVIASINAYPANTTNVSEQLAKAELAKLTDEFIALKAVADAVAAANLG